MGEDVIARCERLEDCSGRAGSRSERGRSGATFDRANSFFQLLPIWIVVARVHESARVSAFHVAFESGRKMNRGRDGAGRGINPLAGVNGEGFNFHCRPRRYECVNDCRSCAALHLTRQFSSANSFCTFPADTTPLGS